MAWGCAVAMATFFLSLWQLANHRALAAVVNIWHYMINVSNNVWKMECVVFVVPVVVVQGNTAQLPGSPSLRGQIGRGDSPRQPQHPDELQVCVYALSVKDVLHRCMFVRQKMPST